MCRKANLRSPLLILHVVLVLAVVTQAEAQPTFSKAFGPSTIGPGSVSTLTFTITGDASPVTDLAFTDTLPAGVVIATPANATTDCIDGLLIAPEDDGTISLSGGRLSAGSTCTVAVDVTSSTSGTHTNTSGDLTSSAGNSGTATADLTVTTDRPGFTKSFSPSAISVGGTSTLTFTLDNTANGSSAFSAAFTDNLPGGMVVANPANASNTCSGTVTATAGTSTISLAGGFLNANTTCTISVDVTASFAGSMDNTTGELTTHLGTSGKAGAVLNVELGFLTKTFTDDPGTPGGTVTLEFTLTNNDRGNTASDIAFTDDLDAALSGLAATGLPADDVCGAGSQLSGTTSLSFTGGSLAAEASCTFSVTLQVPAGATPGTYPNTTSTVSATVDGSPVTYAAASDDLIVAAAPVLTKAFTDDPVAPGGTVMLEFTVENTSGTSSATGITFTDDLNAALAGLAATGLPASDVCGAGSQLSGTTSLSFIGGSLAAGASCTFSVTLQVPSGVPGGSYTNTTTNILATVDGTPVTGTSATDDLVVVSAPTLAKAFTDDPVVPGGTVTLEYTLTYDENAPAGATAIAFTDDLDAALSGLAATGLPADDVCGAGSQLSGTTSLSFTGGSLAAEASCTFSVTLQVPAGALPGTFASTTSNVTASVLGVAATSNPATDNLEVAGLTLTKAFTDDPTVPGGTVMLEFTLNNQSPASSATAIAFTDDLDAALSGLAATGLPADDVCGAGSQLSGTTSLSFTGGSLAAEASCTFSVTLQVPAEASAGEYVSTTGDVTADVEEIPVTLAPVSDNLLVQLPLRLTKAFTDDPVAPGENVTLEFTIANDNPTASATSMAFTDDLDAALSGLAATGLPADDVCGAGSQLSGTTSLSFTGGSLAAEASCTFSVTLQVPAGVTPGTTVTNTTSQITGTVGGTAVTGDAASDDLQLNFFSFTQTLDSPTVPGATPMLTFTIDNLNAGTADNIAFTDDLDAALSGLTATGLPADDICGAGSQLSGTSTLTLAQGTLAAGASCTFSVPLQVPADAVPGSYTNTTSDLLQQGLSMAGPASAPLVVAPTNDSISTAIQVLDVDFANSNVGFSTATPTQDVDDECYATGSDRDVWYKFTPISEGNVTVDIVTATDVSTVLFYTADDENATQYSDLTLMSDCALNDPETQTTLVGQTYYVRVINRNNAGAGVDSDVTFSGTATLPVELTRFEAATDGAAVLLHWQTASETNNAGFEVQHRTAEAPDGASEGAWSALGFVTGHGTSLEPQAYQYRAADLAPGRYAFRLKQVDYDGVFAYSEQVEAEVEVPRELALEPNYPNPFNPQTVISFTVPAEGQATLTVYDVQGRQVKMLFEGAVEPGVVYRSTFEAGGLASGLYFYRLSFNGTHLQHAMLLAK